MRKDVKRTKSNTAYESTFKKLMKEASKATGAAQKGVIQKAHAAIDKAAKRKVIHKNKASRLKSRVSRLSSAK